MARRLEWIDVTKGILIILVVLGHVIPEHGLLWNLIYSFHMPAFVAISGYLAYRPNYIGGGNLKKCLSAIQRRFWQLMWPFLIWSGIMFLCVHNVSNYFSYILYPHYGYWFLWGLFFIVCIFNIIDLVAVRFKSRQEYVVGIVTVGLIVVQMILPDAKYLGYEYISYYFLYYVLGYYLRKYNQVVPVKKYYIISLFVLCLLLGLFWKPLPEVPVLVSWMTMIPGSLLNIGYRMLTAALFIVLMIGIGNKMKVGGNASWRWLKDMGQLSLGIYVVHMILRRWLKPCVDALLADSPEWCKVCLFFILLVIGSYATVRLLNKWKVSSRWLLGKVK